VSPGDTESAAQLRKRLSRHHEQRSKQFDAFTKPPSTTHAPRGPGARSAHHRKQHGLELIRCMVGRHHRSQVAAPCMLGERSVALVPRALGRAGTCARPYIESGAWNTDRLRHFDGVACIGFRSFAQVMVDRGRFDPPAPSPRHGRRQQEQSRRVGAAAHRHEH